MKNNPNIIASENQADSFGAFEEKYRGLLQIIQDAVFIIRDGKILYANEGFAGILDYNAFELTGKGIEELIAPEDLAMVMDRHARRMKGENVPGQYDLRLIKKDGVTMVDALISLAVMHYEGKPAVLGVGKDITERKKAEEKILQEEQRFKALADQSSDIIVMVNRHGLITYINPVAHLQGYSVQDRLGANAFENVHPEDMDSMKNQFNKIFNDVNTPVFRSEVRLRHTDGSWRLFEIMASALRRGNEVESAIANLRDITERRKAEEKIVLEGNRFRALAEHSLDMIIVLDPNGVLTYINPAVEKILGYTVEERIGASGLELVHPDDLELAADKLKILATETNNPVFQGEMRLKAKDGSWRFSETVGSNLVKDNVVEAIIIRQRDVTERKLAEAQRDAAIEKLQKSEKYFRAITDNSSDILIITDKKGKIKYCSHTFERFIGYKPEEVVGKDTISFIHPDDVQRAFRDFSQAIQTDEDTLIHNAFRVVHKDGSVYYLDGIGRNLLNNPDIEGFIMNVRDVTERRRAEEAARKEYAFSRSALDSLTVPFFMFDAESGHFFRWNKMLSSGLGYTDEELLKMRPYDIVAQNDHPRLQSIIEELKQNGHVSFEMNVVSRQGDVFPFLLSGDMVVYNGGPYVIGMGVNIAKIKEVELDLRKSRERYRSVFENGGLPMMIMEESQQIFMVNERFADMLGYRKNEIEGVKKFEDFITSLDRHALMQCFSRRREDKPVEHECQIAHCDGTKFDVLVRIGRIPEAGQYIASFTDITVRKRAEAALLESREHLQKENIRLRSYIRERYRFCDIIGKSQVMQEVYDFILQAAVTNDNVIIYGESGTGKELVARAIHETSSRNGKKFVTVHCGAIPETLMESEFFGYKKGAFTGAHMDKRGYLDEADGGTMFLDEIGEISLSMQVKLLRAVAGDGYTPVGGNIVRKPDVRIIAATNRNIHDMVRKGLIREDFFCRIHILPIYLPSLKERKEDLPLLIAHFLELYDINHEPLPEHVHDALLSYDWPGNIRELQNVLHRYLTLKKLEFTGFQTAKPSQPATEVSQPENKRAKDIVQNVLDVRPLPPAQDNNVQVDESAMNLKSLERDHIMKALSENNWHRHRTASALGISRKTLFRKMQRFGLSQN